MTLSTLRKRLAGWLMPVTAPVSAAVSVSVPADDALVAMLRERGLIPADARVEVVGARPGIRPPADMTDDWTWSGWKQLEAEHARLPGWTFCRFANRSGPDSCAFVFGLVRGSFGLWKQPFPVCLHTDEDDGSNTEVMTCLSHLASGLGIGVFDKLEDAAMAAEIAEQMQVDWSTVDPDNPATWKFNIDTMRESWSFAGIAYAEHKHAHNGPGGPMIQIWERSTAVIERGKPEKLS